MSWLEPEHYESQSGKLIFSMHSWLIMTPDHTILLDTCGGNDKEREVGIFYQRSHPYLENLTAAGVQPEDIDFVLCTHLHLDHVGWNTRLLNGRWVPTFPNARYVFSKDENRRWSTSPVVPAYLDSVLPVFESGQVDLIDGDYSISDLLTIRPAPGHTPGHIVVELRDGGKEGLFIGDALHSPIQGIFPELNSVFCELPDVARSTRLQLLEYCCESGAILIPQHFGRPFIAKVRSERDAFRFDFTST